MATNLRARMWDLLDSARSGGAIRIPAEDDPFFVLNPDYHDGKRGSFLLLPVAFCQSMLLGPFGIQRQDVWTTPIGRLLTVTDRGIVLTTTTTQRMVHVTCDVTEEFRSLGGGAATMGSLDDAARADGWLVLWSDFEAVVTDVATRYRQTTSYSQMMKLPPGAMKGKGGES